MRADLREQGYLPIAQYGIIGDCRSVALVGVDGSIDWCCLPSADRPSLFARILDARRGGCWELAPQGEFRSWQRYSDKTNILVTTFESEGGRAEITDLMPVDERSISEHARPHDHPRLVRVVTGLAGQCPLSQPGGPAARLRSRAERDCSADADVVSFRASPWSCPPRAWSGSSLPMSRNSRSGLEKRSPSASPSTNPIDAVRA